MTYWLIKAEPEDCSIDSLAADGKTLWTGVRNYAARNNLRAMQLGDTCIFYRSMVKPAIVGLANVTATAVQDPTCPDEPAWLAVEISFAHKFSHELPLKMLKTTVGLEAMTLFRISRLSVQPVTDTEFEIIRSMGA